MYKEDVSLGGSAVFLTVFSVLSQLLGFAYRVGLSRMVGAEVMGLYQLVMPVYSVLMSVTAVGLAAAVSNLSSRYLALGNSQAVGQTLGGCVRIFFCLLLPVAAVTVALYDPISVYLLGDARTQLGVVLLLPCVALTGIENCHKHFFYGTGQVRPPAVVELLEQFIRAGAVLGLLALFLPQNPERTVGLIVTGMILCEIFSSIALVCLFRRHMGRIGVKGSGERRGVLYRKVASIALPIGATALVGNLMSTVNAALIPQRLVATGLDRAQAMSAFGVLCGMTLPMLALPTVFLGAINLIMVPRVARSCALGRMGRARQELLGALEIVIRFILPCMALMMVIGPELGMVLFAEEQVGQYVVPLALATVCSCVQGVLGGGLNAVEHPGTAAAIALMCDVVQLALTALLMGCWGRGMDGFVVGIVVSAVLGLVLCIRAVGRHMQLSLGLWKLAGLPGLAALLSWQTSLLLRNWLEQAGADGILRIGIVAVFGGLVYLCALCAMGVQRRDFPHSRKNYVDK